MEPIRGTYDLYDKEMDIHNLVINEIISVVKKYNFSQIKTPIFEKTELFKRSTGEESDIVQKEMYDFEDKGGRSITLRPELTAPTVRAFISNKIFGKRASQYKYFYYGEAFRYERPQKGRFRQFYQFGVEMFEEGSEYSDVEIISLANNILEHLGIKQKVVLKINTIGKPEERKKYNEALKEYFLNKEEDLCDDCKNRLRTNPLRILDCKVDSQKDIIKEAPKLSEFLGEESKKRYNDILELLDELEISYQKEESLVRGLDYYNDIVFEFVYSNNGDEKTVLAGGRYDGLINNIGKKDIPAIGFGIGIERIIDAIKETTPEVFENIKENIDVYYIAKENENKKLILKSMDKLRKVGFVCSATYNDKSIKSHFNEAEKEGAIYVVVTDENTIKTNEVKIKNLITKDQAVVNLEDFEEDLINESK